MAVVRLDGLLEVRRGHAHVRIELRRVQHLVSGLGDRHPLIALLSMLSRRRLVLKACLFEVKIPLDAPPPSLIRPLVLSQDNGPLKAR
jgi:hypothetical protein